MYHVIAVATVWGLKVTAVWAAVVGEVGVAGSSVLGAAMLKWDWNL